MDLVCSSDARRLPERPKYPSERQTYLREPYNDMPERWAYSPERPARLVATTAPTLREVATSSRGACTSQRVEPQALPEHRGSAARLRASNARPPRISCRGRAREEPATAVGRPGDRESRPR